MAHEISMPFDETTIQYKYNADSETVLLLYRLSIHQGSRLSVQELRRSEKFNYDDIKYELLLR